MRIDPIVYDFDKSDGNYHPSFEAAAESKIKTPKRTRDKPSRRYLSCTNCRKDNVDCSLQNWTDQPPCQRCAARNLCCTFNDINKRKSKRKLSGVEPDISEHGDHSSKASKKKSTKRLSATAKKKSTTRLSNNTNTDATMGPGVGNGIGEAQTINTGLSHPVTFLLEGGILDCKFCPDPAYGLLKPDFKQGVVVREIADPPVYIEISGGNNAKFAVTRMCVKCTLSRYHIITCSGHEMEQLGGDLGTNDTEAMTEAQFFRAADKKPLQSDLWCAVCPNIASFKCKTIQAKNKWGVRYPDWATHFGCGLHLCLSCAVKLTNRGNDLDLVVEAACYGENDAEAPIDCPRSDAELLSSKGLLMKAVLKDGRMKDRV
jgi:hypothetical protein